MVVGGAQRSMSVGEGMVVGGALMGGAQESMVVGGA